MAQQDELREELFAACKEEQELSKKEHHQRFCLLSFLHDEQVRMLWSRDGAPSGPGAFLGDYYARFGESSLKAAIEKIIAMIEALPKQGVSK